MLSAGVCDNEYRTDTSPKKGAKEADFEWMGRGEGFWQIKPTHTACPTFSFVIGIAGGEW